jgi:Ni,Fe-hydrogenase III component G
LDTEWGYLAAITGLDPSLDDPNLEVLYQLFSGPAVLTLRVRAPKENPEVPTLCNILPSASFYERELIEMFGITVTGTPDTSRLFLPDEWPEDVYPLRKDFQP